MTTFDKAQVQSYVDSIKTEILANPVLAACTSFTQLHDHCDANMLGDIEGRHFDSIEDMINFANEGMHIVDAWLRERTSEGKNA